MKREKISYKKTKMHRKWQSFIEKTCWQLLKLPFASVSQLGHLSSDSSSHNRQRSRRRLVVESLETRALMASLPLGAAPEDTAEYMLGRIAVTPVLIESDGAIDPNSLNWTPQQKTDVLNNITAGLQWWKDLLATKSSIMTLDWVIDTTYLDTPVESSYEPINRVSQDSSLWVPEFLEHVGYNIPNDVQGGIRAFNQAQRIKNNTDWSYTIFVVNSARDQLFPPNSQFSRAFAYPGGLYVVTPSNRPASTYAHETGHIFWARDEYAGGGSTYFQRRGYYDALNANAIDSNPDPNFQQPLSIMSSSTTLQRAYDTLTTSDATLAQIGWQDSDGDGIFDVLDVPLQLTGIGRFDSTSNTYKFTGHAEAKALANRNSSGLQNDITLNRIGSIQYRFDNDTNWSTATTIDQYVADLNLSIPIPTGTTGTIQIRAIDSRTGITSATYRGSLSGVDGTAENGIAGFIWSDKTNDGQRQSNEPGLAGWNVQVVDSNGLPRDIQTRLEPDLFSNGVISSTSYVGATITAVGADADGTIGVITDNRATTGTKVFIPYSPIGNVFQTGWRDKDQKLRINFASLQSSVSADVIGIDASNYGRLEVYSADGVLLQRINSQKLLAGQSTTLTIARPTADIAYAIVKGQNGTQVGIDNIRFGAVMQTTTGSQGEYYLPGLVAGSYSVRVTPATMGYSSVNPTTAIQTVVVTTAQPTTHVDFGFYRPQSAWQNVTLNTDVNGDGNVFAIDVLQVINAINRYGAIHLEGSNIPTTSFIDVNGDQILTALDVLTVINYINSSIVRSSGEAEAAPPVNQPRMPGDGEDPPTGFEDLYLGDEEEPVAPLAPTSDNTTQVNMLSATDFTLDNERKLKSSR